MLRDSPSRPSPVAAAHRDVAQLGPGRRSGGPEIRGSNPRIPTQDRRSEATSPLTCSASGTRTRWLSAAPRNTTCASTTSLPPLPASNGTDGASVVQGMHLDPLQDRGRPGARPPPRKYRQTRRARAGRRPTSRQVRGDRCPAAHMWPTSRHVRGDRGEGRRGRHRRPLPAAAQECGTGYPHRSSGRRPIHGDPAALTVGSSALGARADPSPESPSCSAGTGDGAARGVVGGRWTVLVGQGLTRPVS